MSDVMWVLLLGVAVGLTLITIARVIAAVARDHVDRKQDDLHEEIQLSTVRYVQDDEREMMITLPSGRAFRGSCTVWHEYPGGRRAGTELELLLCDRWTRAKWEAEK